MCGRPELLLPIWSDVGQWAGADRWIDGAVRGPGIGAAAAWAVADGTDEGRGLWIRDLDGGGGRATLVSGETSPTSLPRVAGGGRFVCAAECRQV